MPPRDDIPVLAPASNGGGGGNGKGAPNSAHAIYEARVASIGHLDADTGYVKHFDTWNSDQSGTGTHFPDRRASGGTRRPTWLPSSNGRKLNTEELRWTYTELYDSKPFACERSHYNQIMNHCSLHEVERMADEWVGRLGNRKRPPIWVLRRKEQGRDTDLVFTDTSLRPPLDGAEIKKTGNADLDRAAAGMHANMDRFLSHAPTSMRNFFGDQNTKLAVVASNAFGEVQEKVALGHTVKQLEGAQQSMQAQMLAMQETLKRLESKK